MKCLEGMRLSLVLAASLCMLAVPCTAQDNASYHYEHIQSFVCDVRLNHDASLDVSETITIDFADHQRHGIFVTIPVSFKRLGNQFSTTLNVVDVIGGQGHNQNLAPIPFMQTREGDNTKITIGDPKETISGENVYKIHYVTRRAVNFFSGAPEVYWNVTGNEWPYPIDQATANFYPPPGVNTSEIKTASYVGALGSKTTGKITTKPDRIVYEASKLDTGEGLTLVAGLPEGCVVPPSMVQEIAWYLADWWPAIVVPALTILLMFSVWWKAGRDPQRLGPVAVDWNPPKELSPAEVGTLMDNSCDMADVVSILIDLAVRGHIRIHELPAAGILGHKDYEFDRLSKKEELKPFEEEFLKGLFGKKGKTAKLSDLRSKFYSHAQSIMDSIYVSLKANGYFKNNPQSVKNVYYRWAVGVAVLGFFFMVAQFFAWTCGFWISTVILVLGARKMPARTEAGVQALRQILGFRLFVHKAEKERIRVLAQEDPTIFGRLLPYAMVLGAAKQWAEAFHDLLHQPPDWYVPYGSGTSNYVFDSRTFINNLGSGMQTVSSTFASTPSSSSSGAGGGYSGSSDGFSGVASAVAEAAAGRPPAKP
jgi:hypothetical protein